MDAKSAIKLGLVLIGIGIAVLGSLRAAKFIEYRAKGGRDGYVNALRFGHLHQVEDFLKLGADPNVQDEEGRPLLLLALMAIDRRYSEIRTINDKYRLVELLIEYGADPNFRADGHLTPAEYVHVSPSDPREVDLLKQAGADTTLMSLVFSEDWAELKRWVERDPALIGQTLYKNRNLLHWAAAARADEFVQFLLEQGADPNMRNAAGHSAFTLAYSSSDEFGIFMSGYGNFNFRRTPESDHLLDRQLRTLDALLAAGAEKFTDPDNDLHLAHALAMIEGGVLHFQRYGIDPTSNLRTHEGSSVMQFAVKSGQTENAKWLWQQGVTEAPPISHVPYPERHVELIRMLLERGSLLDVQREPWYPLPHQLTRYAVDGDEQALELLQILLEHNLNPNFPDREGKTALSVWVDAGSWLLQENHSTSEVEANMLKVGRLLLEYGADPLDGTRFHTNPWDEAEAAECEICLELFRETLATRAAKLIGMAS